LKDDLEIMTSKHVKNDSGYISSSDSEEKMLVDKDHYNTVIKGYVEKFSRLLKILRKKNGKEQFDVFEEYLMNESFGANHFEILDLFLKEKDRIIMDNEDNMGASLLLITRNFHGFPNKEIILKLIEIYSAEKKIECSKVITGAIDLDGDGVLHELAAGIVYKYEQWGFVTEKDWEAFNELLLIDENLKNLENYSGRTPEDIITETTNLTLIEGIVYSIS
jgi:hypothetical protein